jgi:predicted O-methyltransferase YrrM
MDSLSTGQVADTLARLHKEAENADRALMETFQTNPQEFMTEWIERERKDYRSVCRELSGAFLSVTPSFGRFLYMCVRMTAAKRVVEFGSSMGLSAIYLACGLKDNGGGRLIGTELEASKAERAGRNIAAAGLSELVEIRVGDALETLRALDGDIDLVLMDGSMTLYLAVLKLIEPRLRPGALIIGENAVEGVGPYLDYVRDPANGYLSQPIPVDEGRGNELTVRTG